MQTQSTDSKRRCMLCLENPAAVRVVAGTSVKQRTSVDHYCLLHYYSTTAVHTKPGNVHVINQEEWERQLPEMQSLFADVYVELKQELAEEMARSVQATAKDPLAIIGKLHKSSSNPKKRQKPPPVRLPTDIDENGGGFMQHIPLPERLVRTQHQQAERQRLLVRRMEEASKISSSSHTQRRKPTRKSIWNVLEDAENQPASRADADDIQNGSASFLESTPGISCESCGSHKVICLSSNTIRNNESTKGEIWGSGSRDDVVTRYQCSACGRTWNEQE